MRNATPVSLMIASTAVLGLVACATPPAPPMPPAAGTFQCVAEAGAWAIGEPVGDELVAKVQADTHSRAVRVIRPGQAVTMDFRGDRVNVMLDGHDKVERVTCG
jgi:hypothetical protein